MVSSGAKKCPECTSQANIPSPHRIPCRCIRLGSRINRGECTSITSDRPMVLSLLPNQRTQITAASRSNREECISITRDRSTVFFLLPNQCTQAVAASRGWWALCQGRQDTRIQVQCNNINPRQTEDRGPHRLLSIIRIVMDYRNSKICNRNHLRTARNRILAVMDMGIIDMFPALQLRLQKVFKWSRYIPQKYTHKSLTHLPNFESNTAPGSYPNHQHHPIPHEITPTSLPTAANSSEADSYNYFLSCLLGPRDDSGQPQAPAPPRDVNRRLQTAEQPPNTQMNHYPQHMITPPQNNPPVLPEPSRELMRMLVCRVFFLFVFYFPHL